MRDYLAGRAWQQVREQQNRAFGQLVSGRRVVIVGPAECMDGSGQGDTIERQFDLVVRMNRTLPIPARCHVDVGRRTDILYHCLEPHPTRDSIIDPVFWKGEGVRFLCCPYPTDCWFNREICDRFKHQNNGLLPFRDFDPAIFRDLEAQLGTRPNTGLLAILDILRFNPGALYVTGVTFGRDGYYSGYNGQAPRSAVAVEYNSRWHLQAPQIKFLREVIKNNPAIRVDQTLQKILDE